MRDTNPSAAEEEGSCASRTTVFSATEELLVLVLRNSYWGYNNPERLVIGMDWGLRIRKDVPSWVVTLVLVGAILLVGTLQYFNII